MKKKPDKVDQWLSAAFLATPVLILIWVFWSGTARLKRTREKVRVGMTVEEVTGMFGRPSRVVKPGEPIRAGRTSYQLPPRDQDTAVHIYSRDGIPYYILYVFVDQRSETVLRSEIENLWW